MHGLYLHTATLNRSMRGMFPIVAVIMLAVMMSLGLIYYLLNQDGGPAEPVWAIVAALAIGCAAAQVAGVINGYLVPFSDNQITSLSSALLIGIIPGIYEEILKFIPMSFFVSSQRFFRAYSDGVVYFSLSGLAFGLLENIDYTVQMGASVGLQRLLTLLFFHAATSGIYGFYFVRARAEKKGTLAVKMVLLLVLSHAVYNFSLAYAASFPPLAFFVYSIPGVLTLYLFHCFKRARDLDRQALSHPSQ